MVRIPAFREFQRQLMKDSIPGMLADDFTRREFDAGVKQFGDPSVSYEEYRRMVRTGEIPFPLSRYEELRSMTQQVEAIVPWLFKRRWSVRVVPPGTPLLVSSDVPVKSITRTSDGFSVTTGRLGWPSTEIFLTISSHALVHGRFSPPRVSPLTPAAIRDFNRATMWTATRIFSAEPHVAGIET